MCPDRVLSQLGSPVLRREHLHGGDLSEVDRLDLGDGRIVVLKTGAQVEVEGRMLATLGKAGLPVPQVIAQNGKGLVMQFLPEERATFDHWTRVGTALRALHDVQSSAYGWEEEYALGRVHIPGGLWASWPDYWGEMRIGAKLSSLPRDIAARIETLLGELSQRLPERPAASLLHGDLWQGNIVFGPDATVHFIDPACSYGHAEVDLAMLNLFGSPGAGFDDAYGPLEDGWEARRPIYQLWPALVHLRLFGNSYRAMVERLLEACGV